MEPNLTKPLAFFDLEATGTNVGSDRIVEIAIIKLNPDGSVVYKPDLKKESRFLINPEMPIPPEVSEIHGIYDEDVADKPTFADVAESLFKFLFDCDLAGYNSNKFDIPMLAEEFLRCGITFDLRDRNLIDVQNIFHLMEQRTLKAAYKFYCQKELKGAHEAMADVQATMEVFKAQLDRYKEVEIEDKKGNTFTPVVNDMSHLHEVSQRHKNVDLMGRIVYNSDNVEVFNFGKFRGQPVEEVLKKEPGYYGWMMNGDFPRYTKMVLKEIKERIG